MIATAHKPTPGARRSFPGVRCALAHAAAVATAQLCVGTRFCVGGIAAARIEALTDVAHGRTSFEVETPLRADP
jgi:hypothetical protein